MAWVLDLRHGIQDLTCRAVRQLDYWLTEPLVSLLRTCNWKRTNTTHSSHSSVALGIISVLNESEWPALTVLPPLASALNASILNQKNH